MNTRSSSPLKVVRPRKPAAAVHVQDDPAAPSSAGTAPRTTPVLTWDGPTSTRIAPGRYQAIAVRAKGPEWCKRWHRWSLLIEFALIAEPACLVAYFNMGDNPDKCEVKRRSNYFKAWTIASGAPPEKHQKMTPDVFMQNQIFTVEVTDSGDDPKGTPKTDAEKYSIIRAVISAEYR
jgi:hypothetical protein